jgi:alanine dehydrogenase
MASFSSRTTITFGQRGLFPREEMLETGRKKQQIIIGIPKELNRFESRIALSPQGVEMLVDNGHVVLVESGAGDEANYSDKDFAESGAVIMRSAKEIFSQSDVILKISAPSEVEIEMMHGDQLIMSYVSPYYQSRERIVKMLEKRINAIGFEYYRDSYNILPVVRIMSEIEGYAAIMVASEYLSKSHNGKGVLLGGITGISPAEVVIIGAGTAGEFAARAAIGLGAQVKVFDNSLHNLHSFEHYLGQRVFTSVLHPQVISKALKSADAVIANRSYTEADIPFLVSEELLSLMKRGAVVVDLCIEQGGCFESSSSTNFEYPVFSKYGVIHYCVANIASRVSRTASIALSNIFAPLLLGIAERGGIHQAIKEDEGIASGMYIYKGILTNNQIGRRFGIQDTDIGLLLSAF